MAQITQTQGNAGPQREFSACPSHRYINVSGTDCIKVDDARAVRLDNGVLFSPAQDLIVTLIDDAQVTVSNPLQAATDVAVGNGYRSGGHNYMRTPDGALNLDTREMVFSLPDSGDVQIGTGLSINIDP